jgi:aminoglycoside 3-N-acetyltransferase I
MPLEGYEIRELGPDDLALMRGMLRVFAEAFDDPGAYLSRPPEDDYLRELLGSGLFVAIAACCGEEVVGGLAGYVLPKFEQRRSEFYLYDLAVLEGHRRRGVATAMIEALKVCCRSRGVHVIFVQADLGDDEAIALYSKLGRREDVSHSDIEPRGG